MRQLGDYELEGRIISQNCLTVVGLGNFKQKLKFIFSVVLTAQGEKAVRIGKPASISSVAFDSRLAPWCERDGPLSALLQGDEAAERRPRAGGRVLEEEVK